MKIALIGATGFVGSAILKEALSRDHQVTAILRHPEKLTVKDPDLMVVKGDIMDTERLAFLLKGHDIVISAYNPGWTNPDIYNEFLKGSQSVQQAVKKSGVKRYLVMGGAGSLFIAPGKQLVDTREFPEIFKGGASAARDYLNTLKKEDQLEWTFLSPAIEMNPALPHKRTGRYRVGADEPVFDDNKKSAISVEDVAVAAMDEAEHPGHIRKRFTVAW